MSSVEEKPVSGDQRDYTLNVPADMKARMQRLRDRAGYPRTLAPFALRLLERGIRLEEESLGMDKPA